MKGSISDSDSVKKLLHTEDKQLADLHQIVSDSLKEERLISHHLRKELLKKPSLPERLADVVASFGGSWRFKRSEHDYLINLKAEIEIRALHQKLDLLILDQVKTLLETQKQQLEYLEDLRGQVNERK